MSDRNLSLTPTEREAHRGTILDDLAKRIDAAQREVAFYDAAIDLNAIKPATEFNLEDAGKRWRAAQDQAKLLTASRTILLEEWELIDRFRHLVEEREGAKSAR